MAIYRVTFSGLHILRFKAHYGCGDKYRIQEFNLKQEVKKLKKTCDDSDYLLGFLEEEDNADNDDDDLIASISPLDMKIKKNL